LELARSSVEFASLATVSLVMVKEHGSRPNGAYPIWFQGQPRDLGRKMISMLQPVHESLKALAVQQNSQIDATGHTDDLECRIAATQASYVCIRCSLPVRSEIMAQSLCREANEDINRTERFVVVMQRRA
jgi:hypothetical protein